MNYIKKLRYFANFKQYEKAFLCAYVKCIEDLKDSDFKLTKFEMEVFENEFKELPGKKVKAIIKIVIE